MYTERDGEGERERGGEIYIYSADGWMIQKGCRRSARTAAKSNPTRGEQFKSKHQNSSLSIHPSPQTPSTCTFASLIPHPAPSPLHL
jgi:hypothetical protein